MMIFTMTCCKNTSKQVRKVNVEVQMFQSFMLSAANHLCEMDVQDVRHETFNLLKENIEWKCAFEILYFDFYIGWIAAEHLSK